MQEQHNRWARLYERLPADAIGQPFRPEEERHLTQGLKPMERTAPLFS